MGNIWSFTRRVDNSGDNNAQENAVDTLLANFLYPEELKDNVFIPRFKHRISIVNAWNIPLSNPSSPLKIVDIGCGQGESSVTLAVLLGSASTITGIDTARPDYGGPYTVSETHAHISASSLGKQISFQRKDAASFFATRPPVDAVTLCHSLWYFPSPESVAALFTTLAQVRVPRVYLAEYAFAGSLPDGQQEPHILAARAQALFHSYKQPQPADPGPRAPNVRSALAVERTVQDAAAAGFVVRRRGTFVPAADMIEGHLEARYVVKDMFAESVRAEGLAPELEEKVMAYVPKVKAALERLAAAGVEKSRAMDVWWAELELEAKA